MGLLSDAMILLYLTVCATERRERGVFVSSKNEVQRCNSGSRFIWRKGMHPASQFVTGGETANGILWHYLKTDARRTPHVFLCRRTFANVNEPFVKSNSSLPVQIKVALT